MTEKEHVESIMKVMGEIDRKGVLLHHSLETLSSAIYADTDRFIYELLQNACDAATTEGVTVTVSLDEEGVLSFCHDGVPFSKENVDSLCGVAESTKGQRVQQIGYKGIGFKSVFGQSGCVAIQSGKYSFRFDREFWEDKLVPWQIAPIWTDPDSVTIPSTGSGITTIVLRLHKGVDVTGHLLKMAENPEFVLFLTALKSFRIETGGIDRTISKHRVDELLEIQVDGKTLCRYLIREYHRKVSPEVRLALKEDGNIPPKMKEIDIVPISLALPISADGRPVEEKQPLFSYFPTKERIGLPLLVNSLFHTTASRETLSSEHTLNKFIVCEIAACVTEWLAEMALNPGRRPDMLLIIPGAPGSSPSLARDFDAALQKAFAATACVPDASGTRCILAATGFNDSAGLLCAIDADTFVTADGTARHRIHPSLRGADRLERFGLRKVTIVDLPRIVTQFRDILTVAATNFAFAQQLQRYGQGTETVKNTPWLLSSDGRLLRPGQLFWPPEDPEVAEALPEELPQVHPLFVKESAGSPALKTWLMQTAGVASIEPAAIVRNYLLPLLKEGTLSESRSRSWLRVAFQAYQDHKTHQNLLTKPLTEEEFRLLGALPVATRNGGHKRARECCLGLPYFADTEWDTLAAAPSFFDLVAGEYVSGGTPESWLGFFTAIQVSVIPKYLKEQLIGAMKLGTQIPETRREFWTFAAYKLHCEKRLNPDDYAFLGALPLETKTGEKKPARDCWLGAPYASGIDWENLLGSRADFHFVAAGYLRLGGSAEEWEAFFRKIGVSDGIRFRALGDLNRKQLSERFPNYLAFLDAEVIIPKADRERPLKHLVQSLCWPNVHLDAFKDDQCGYLLGRHFVKKALSSESELQGKYIADKYYYFVPSTIRYLLKKRRVWPGSDKKCHLASELIVESPENRILVGDDIPFIDAEDYDVSPKVLADYGCKRVLDTRQCLWLLGKIAESSDITAATKERIDRIYRRLEAIRTGPSGLDLQAVGDWGTDAALLSEAGTFCHPTALNVAEDSDELLLFDREERPFIGELASNEAYRLLTGLGVRPVSAAEIEVVTCDESASPELTQIIHNRRHMLAMVAAGQQASLQAVDDLRKISSLESLECFRVRSYVLRQADTSRTKEGSKLSCVVSGTNKLYFMGNEKDVKVIYAVAQELARRLENPKCSQGIDLLLRLSEADGKDWLARQGFDVSVLPAPVPEPAATPAESPVVAPKETAPPKPAVEMYLCEPARFLPELREKCRENRFCATQESGVTRDFAERLIADLAKQKSRWSGFIYHFTHVENLVKILKQQAIKSRSRSNSFCDSAGGSLIAHTSETVKGFARFYFRPLTPTQWHNQCLGRSYGDIRALCPVPIFIRLPLREVLAAAGSRCAVSNGNMASQSSRFGNHPEFLDHFDHANVYANHGEVSVSKFLAASQQEFLVQEELSLADLPITLICRNEQDFGTLCYLMEAAGITGFRSRQGRTGKNEVVIDPALYYDDVPSLEVGVNQGTVAAKLLTGKSLRGDFCLNAKSLGSDEVSSTAVVSTEGNASLEISFGLRGTSDADVNIHYLEAGKRWLVYGGIVKRA
ncbi:DarT ssDNA thymidine ADP-ribosyltransferase family protein [Geomonas agri]|uniref:DarT ssDNA thymidine ADP-ribosyltransferase family protein n=1 Tax=Geomonas agri TaxID=2873702 RepID=UPI001CD4125A|nr:DarT ssDNA thymidine ADP-ribosyltransferase family protein [Geomonas agri]